MHTQSPSKNPAKYPFEFLGCHDLLESRNRYDLAASLVMALNGRKLFQRVSYHA